MPPENPSSFLTTGEGAQIDPETGRASRVAGSQNLRDGGDRADYTAAMEAALAEALGQTGSPSPAGETPADGDGEGAGGGPGAAGSTPSDTDSGEGQDEGTDGTGDQPWYLQEPDGSEPTATATETDDGDDQTEQAEPQAQAEEPTEPASTGSASLDDLLTEVYGRRLTSDEAYSVAALLRDISSLPPDKAAALEQALYGQPSAQPPPAGYPSSQGPSTAPAAAQGQPGASSAGGPGPAAPASPSPDADDEDPYLSQHLAPVREELADVRERLAAREAQEAQAQRAALQRGIESGFEEFRQSYSHLSNEDLGRLYLRVQNEGTLVGHYQSTGDGREAMRRALEQTYWADPTYRQAEIDRRVQEAQEQVMADMRRQAKAGSLSPSGASAPRETPPPRTRDERDAALVAGLAEAMAEGTNGSGQ